MCNKAGLVSTGAAKVEKAIASAPIAAMVHATDGGADGMRKIGQALTRAYGEAAVSVPESFSSLRANWIWHWGGQM